jgi:hypothetical protein
MHKEMPCQACRLRPFALQSPSHLLKEEKTYVETSQYSDSRRTFRDRQCFGRPDFRVDGRERGRNLAQRERQHVG